MINRSTARSLISNCFEIAIFDMTGGFITRQIIGGDDDVAGFKSRDEISSIMERLTNIR